jgi:iron complex transport system permease protein
LIQLKNQTTPLFIVLLVLLTAAFLLQLFVGSVSLPFNVVINALLGNGEVSEVYRNIVLESRLPGALAALLAGAGLAVSGLQMQTMF